MTKSADMTPTNGVAPGKLGTFGGVFTPSVLTILGIILFLRLGYVVGSAGLMRALLMIAAANLISVLTSISLSAIATNLRVKGGGDYYLISRTLGVEFGGALGLVLFLAQSVSIAFYCIGFAEAICALITHPLVNPRLVAFVAVSFLFLLAWLGADVATRFQYAIMAILALALLSFYIGAFRRWDTAIMAANWQASGSGAGFWVLFAIFFPAVTGFTQGVSMSGDLADPGRSLPKGTFWAVGVSIVVYFSVALLFAATQQAGVLQQDYGAMKRVAAWDVMIDAGVIAATLSSAIASFLGAPRILQSLAGDQVFPFLKAFARGAGPSNNPRRGALLSFGIALATIALGNLNVVASVVSMFFLISYGLLNYATYFEARGGSPSFRPRFRLFNQWLSLAGALGCLGAMLAIDASIGILAVALIFAVYQYIKRTAGPARWADSQRSWRLQQIQEQLHLLADEPEHPRNWRPHILALSKDTGRRHQLLQVAEWISGRSGFVTAVSIIGGTGSRMLRQQAEAEETLRIEIAKSGVSAFPRAITMPESETALETLVQSYGIGALKANTILTNWYSHETETDPLKLERMSRTLRGAYRLGCNILMANIQEPLESEEEDAGRQRRIDIWWQDDATGRLSLLLAFLMKRSAVWQDARISVLTMDARFEEEVHRRALEQEIQDSRIDSQLEILIHAGIQQLVDRSAQSDFVFLPFRFRHNRVVSLMNHNASELMRWLAATLLIQAAEDIDLDAEPESGEVAQRAEVLDALQEAEKRTMKAAREAEAMAAQASEARQRLAQARAEGRDETTVNKAEKEARLAGQAEEKASRKAAKEEVRLAQAQKEAEQIDPMLGVEVSKKEA